MSKQEQHKPDEVDLVDRATAALRDVATPDGPSAELLANTLSAIHAAENGRHLGVNHSGKRRILTMRFIAKLAVAAVLALVVGSFIFTSGLPRGSQAAFADVLEKVQQAKNVRFKVVSTFKNPAPNMPRSVELSMLLWADPQTHLSVRMETTVNMPMAPVSEVVMKDFEWDVTVDESAVRLDVPAGYEVQTTFVSAARPTEAELAESLRTLAKLNGGKFPDTFDFTAMSKLPMAQGPDKHPTNEQMQTAMTLMRGLTFVQRENGEDFHYAGKGVPLNQPNQPLFWYRPVNSETYHVIDADLTVHTDVKPDDLPKIDSQKLTPGTKLETDSATPGFLQSTQEQGKAEK